VNAPSLAEKKRRLRKSNFNSSTVAKTGVSRFVSVLLQLVSLHPRAIARLNGRKDQKSDVTKKEIGQTRILQRQLQFCPR
jgi:hypothetical protein